MKNWEKPITIARHAYGDVYKSVEIRADEPGVAKLVFEGKSGKKQEVEIHNFDGAGVIQGMHNTDKSIRSFAHSCFKFAIDTKQDLWFATKDTISRLTMRSSVRSSKRFTRVTTRRSLLNSA